MTGGIHSTTTTKLYYQMDTDHGQSGSPVFAADNYVVYGIHSRPNSNETLNIAVRITMEVYTCLERITEIDQITGEVFP